MTYGQYGYAPFNPAVAPAYPLAPYNRGYLVGADAPAATPTMMDKFKTWAGTKTIDSIPNGYILGGAAAIGLVWLLHAKKVL